MPLLRGGQSFEDKLSAVKYFLSGQGLSFVVLKATTSQLIGPKKKHLNYLVTVTGEPNVSVPNLVACLIDRAKHPDWRVVFKSIITIHYLISYGNENFIHNLASSTVNYRFIEQLASFVDRSSSLAYDMSIYLRRYSRYISSKVKSYRELGTDFCRMNTTGKSNCVGNNGNQSSLQMRTMQLDQLTKILPILQNQFDALMAFDVSVKNLNNGVINTAFAMLYKDFVKLYITYQTAIIRLLEIYFTVKQVKRAQELLEAYKKFLVRMDKVSDFMRVIDSVGMDKSDMPNVSRSPNLSLKLLEKHLSQLEESSKRQQMNRMQSVELPRIEYATMTGLRRRQSSRNSRDFSNPNVIISSEFRRNKRPNYENFGELLKTDLIGPEKKKRENTDDIGERIRQLTRVGAKEEEENLAFSLLLPTNTGSSSSSNNNNNHNVTIKCITTDTTDPTKTTNDRLGSGDLLLLAMDEAKTDVEAISPPEEADLMVMDDSFSITVAEQLSSSTGATNSATNNTLISRTPSDWVQVEL